MELHSNVKNFIYTKTNMWRAFQAVISAIGQPIALKFALWQG